MFMLAGLAILALAMATMIWRGMRLKRSRQDYSRIDIATFVIAGAACFLGWALIYAGASASAD
jgi:Flp pilus assembly protein TadB